MIKGIKKGLAVFAAMAMTAGCLVGCSGNLDSDAVVAVVGEENVPMGVASVYARYQQAQMYQMYAAYMGTTTIFDQYTATDSTMTFGDEMKAGVIEDLMGLYVLRSHAADYEVALTAEEETAIAEAAKSFVEANDKDVLKKLATTEEYVAEMLSLLAYSDKMYDAMVADVDTEVSDEEAAQSKLTYVTISTAGTTDADGNTVALTEDELAAKEELAQSVLDKIMAEEDVAAADMDALAKEVDETLSATSYTYDDEDTYLDTAIFDAVEGLSDGEMVETVVESSDGTALYVVRFDAALDRDATDYQKENIVMQRQNDDYSTELEEWKAAGTFETKEAWDDFTITDSDVYTFKVADTTVTE